MVNRPQAQWISPGTTAPGEAIRIFGRTLAWGWQIEPAVAYARRVGGGEPIRLARAPRHREDGHTERWCLSAWLPDDSPKPEVSFRLPPGIAPHVSTFGQPGRLSRTAWS